MAEADPSSWPPTGPAPWPPTLEEWKRLGRIAAAVAAPKLDGDEDLEAVVQEVLAALAGVAQPPHDVDAWTKRTASNKAFDLVRGKCRDRALVEKLKSVRGPSDTTTCAADEVLFGCEDVGVVKLVVEILLPKLTPRERQAVELRCLQGLDRETIAEEMGVTVNTVKTLLVRGLRNVRLGLAVSRRESEV